MTHLDSFDMYSALLKYFTVLKDRGYKDETLSYGHSHRRKLNEIAEIMNSDGISTKFTESKSAFKVHFSW